MTGPSTAFSQDLHATKYRLEGETYEQAMKRVAHGLADNDFHEHAFYDIISDMRFLAGGRIQSAIGSNRRVTAQNCFVSQTIPDSYEGIMDTATKAGRTMRMGGGIGYDFSTLRPKNDLITTLGSGSSGPVAWMSVNDGVCGAICSAGHRRGAQMAVLRVDHPDIEEFITAKQNTHRLLNFNISVGITDKFMEAVKMGLQFDLVFGGKVYKTVDARSLWDQIMRATWDWAEPGVIFLDRMNQMNNLWYCETLAATNPCAEQPLPPHGACLLGSFNMVKYLYDDLSGFDYTQLCADIPQVVRAMDNVIDRTHYPLPEQEAEAQNKRRMGLGVTGAANAIEALGHPYGSDGFKDVLDEFLEVLTNEVYRASAMLAREKGAFPAYKPLFYNHSKFIETLDDEVLHLIHSYGTRNSHLISIAPTGTISLCADNVSSGIEPVFSVKYQRTIQTASGPQVVDVIDYGVNYLGTEPKTADQCSVDDHIGVLLVAQRWTDSAVSKTCNVGDDVTFEEFKAIYMKAYDGGAKGCTTFRASGKRMGILVAKKEEEEVAEGTACYINPETGMKECA